ncbi:uncharacterized protein DEA37_0007496 [Paragonimus westermani]|uniref:G-protein coupled receptors family 1 profile domain-containing protein n=2 Tax=Paragonimus westermani TaxID=34504 RepID=A0A5J4NRK6_9TREM|nr:uncharacterized protein DEA37_0007496 [Paragonimus westermani]
MKTQFLFDGSISFIALITLVHPDNLHTSLQLYERIKCYLWVGRFIFWFFVLLSASNLLCIAADRLRAIIFSASYDRTGKLMKVMCYTGMFTYALLNSLPFIFTVEFVDNKCTHQIEHKASESLVNYVRFCALLWMVTGYLLPGISMVICHLTVFRFLRKIAERKLATLHRSISVSSFSNSCNSLNRSILVSSMIMCAAFLITHAYRVVYFLLYAYQYISLDSVSVARRLGIFLTIVNSALNPLLMVLSSPPFRHRLFLFLFKCRRQNKTTVGVSLEQHIRTTR